MRAGVMALALCAGLTVARADDGAEVEVCFNYGCLSSQVVHFSAAQIASLKGELARADDAAAEREALAQAVARLYRWAGGQSPIGVDRAGDYLDDGVYGRMDCIDHAHTTTRMLEVLQRAGALRHHRVLDVARRRSWLIMQHFSAVIEDTESGRLYAVDTWFRDHAEPAVVMEMEQWKDGGYPDD